jgi:hypothetical protein
MIYDTGVISRPWLPSGIRNLFLFHRQDTLIALGVIDLVALAIARFRQRFRNATVVWLGLLCLGVITLALDWAGDSYEVGRHAVEGAIGTALAAIMLLASSQIEEVATVEDAQNDQSIGSALAFPLKNL